MKNLKRVLSLLLCLIMVVGLVPTTAFAATHPYLTKAPENITLAPGESKGVSVIFAYRVIGGTDWGNANISGDSYGFDRLINFGAQAGVEVTPYTFTYDATKAGTTETYWLSYTCTDANSQNLPGEKVSFTVTYVANAGETTITGVQINPTSVSMQNGKTKQFTATVTGSGDYNQNVTWSVENATDSNTKISASGLLTVGAAETAKTLTVKATSVGDSSKSASARVELVATVSGITIDPASVYVIKGNTQQFTATLTGIGNYDKTILWSIPSEHHEDTKISNDGLLTVSASETAETLRITATSGHNLDVWTEAAVTVAPCVTSISITPDSAEVEKGTTRQFTATLTGVGDYHEGVLWSLPDNHHPDTKISDNGLLTVSASETEETLRITATSVESINVWANAYVTVTEPAPITSISVTGVETPSVGMKNWEARDAIVVSSTPDDALTPFPEDNFKVCDTNSSDWNDWTAMSMGDAFEAGKYYAFVCTVEAAEGYAFSESVTGQVNGNASDSRFGTVFQDESEACVYYVFGPLEAAPTTYTIIAGANGEYQIGGSADKLSFTADGDFSKFSSVEVDSVALAESNYEAKSGSTIVELKKAYLDTLAPGEHTLKVKYTDGDVSTKFTIKSAASTPEIWVGGVGMVSGDYLAQGASATTTTKPDDNYAYYKDGVLTLHNYSYSGAGYSGFAVYCPIALTMELEGENSLTGKGNEAIAVVGGLIIGGNGKLALSSDYEYCVYSTALTFQDSCTVTADTGIYASGVLSVKETAAVILNGSGELSASQIDISGGTVTVTAIDNYGIYAGKDISISGGTITVTARKGDTYSGVGIYSHTGNIEISGGTVTVNADGNGIYAYRNLTISGGTVTVTAGVWGIKAQHKDLTVSGGNIDVKSTATGDDDNRYYALSYSTGEGSLTFDKNLAVLASTEPDGTFVPYVKADNNTYDHVKIGTEPAPTTYTVTFDSNGGSAVTAQTVESGKTATKPTDPTKSGYTFQGWTYKGSPYDFSKPVAENITLYARWGTEYNITAIPTPISGQSISSDDLDSYFPSSSSYTYKNSTPYWYWYDTGVPSGVAVAGTNYYAYAIMYLEDYSAVPYEGDFVVKYAGTELPKISSTDIYNDNMKSGYRIYMYDTYNVALQVRVYLGTPTGAGNTYHIISGANGIYQKGSTADKLSFTADGNIADFIGVEVDGYLINVSDYNVESGSTIVELKKAYLESLSAGEHTLKIRYHDGEASTKFTVKDVVPTTYTVTVENGTGDGDYASGATVTVTADTIPGKLFREWTTSDGVTFADSKSATTTFTMPDKYVTVTAVYDTVISVIDISGITEPVAGAVPSDSFTISTTGVEVGSNTFWQIYDEATNALKTSYADSKIVNNEPFRAGTYVKLQAEVIAKEGYVFTPDTVIRYNGVELPAKDDSNLKPNFRYPVLAEHRDRTAASIGWTVEEPDANTATIVVKKTDEKRQPLAGATFTMTGTNVGAGGPYTATSDANGLATFTNVSEGSYNITETTAPAGYQLNTTPFHIDVNAQGKGIIYGEDAPNGKEYNNNDPFVFVNERISEPDPAPTTSVTVTKIWVGPEGTQIPESVTVLLLADGVEVSRNVLSSRNNWTYTFENLPLNKADDGAAITYTVDEVAVEGYEKSIKEVSVPTGKGFEITNTLEEEPETVDVAGIKTWVGDEEADRPESIIVNLLADGKVIAEAEVTARTQWTFHFNELPKYDEAGEEIEYTVEEEEVEGYTASYEGFNITNTKNETPAPTTSVTVNKVWAGNLPNNMSHPTSVTVFLKANGTKVADSEVTLNANKQWTHTWEDLPAKDANGRAIEYMVGENAVANYTASIAVTDAVNHVFKITNTWNPTIAPVKYTVTYKANGGSGTMTSDTVDAGTEYTIRANGFTAPSGKKFKCWKIGNKEYDPGEKITVNSDVTITAVWKNKTSGGSSGLDYVPKTGDSSGILLWTALGLMSAMALAGVEIYRKRRAR